MDMDCEVDFELWNVMIITAWLSLAWPLSFVGLDSVKLSTYTSQLRVSQPVVPTAAHTSMS